MFLAVNFRKFLKNHNVKTKSLRFHLNVNARNVKASGSVIGLELSLRPGVKISVPKDRELLVSRAFNQSPRVTGQFQQDWAKTLALVPIMLVLPLLNYFVPFFVPFYW